MNFKSAGKAMQVKDGIVIADGLSDLGINEIVHIESVEGEMIPGVALNLEEGQAGIVVLANFDELKAGANVYATGELLSVEVSDAILGHSVDALGKSLLGEEIKHKKSKDMPIERIAPSVSQRQDVFQPMQTGIKAIDSMIPIGKGQRELIIGDRQTGKTAIGIDSIINQKGSGMICIYAAIGQKASKVSQIKAKLELEGVMENSVIVAANASDPAAMQYIAPYTATAIGEFFAQQGRDVLVIYDDLTKHAWSYREISLLLKRPPGREAYPGDVFYLHSRLLERAVQYSEAEGSGSLTALPIIETQAGDISAYVPTNVISITDGQIYLESELFNSGQRPAINVGLSVSRVGGAAQTKAMKQVAGELRLDLAQYRELAAFAQFGSDLDEETQAKLDRGARIQELLKQNQYDTISVAEQILILFAGVNGYLDELEVKQVKDWEVTFRTYLTTKKANLLEELKDGPKLEGKLEQKVKEAVEKFKY